MFIHDHNETRPNYLVEALAATLIVVCIGINLFGNDIGFTTLDSKPADGFGGFTIVNVPHAHR